MAQDYTQVNFRIPTSLKEKIESSALENNRSITSELVSRLEQSFEQHDQQQIDLLLMTEVYREQQRKIDELHTMVQKLLNK